MREILFRGKRVDNGEWIEGFYGHSGDKMYIIFDNGFAIAYFRMKEVIPETVGQFTGLTDKNGKKIFEGDIAKVYSNCDNFFTEKSYINGIVTFDNIYGFEYIISFDHIRSGCQEWFGNYGKDLEVIGNIYDNPKLLEVEE